MDLGEKGKLRDETVEFLFDGNGEKTLNEMTMTVRTVGSMVTTFIQCWNCRDMTPFDHILIYKIMKRYKIDFGDYSLHNLRVTIENPLRMLPYGLMITGILRALNISIRGDISVQIKHYIGKLSTKDQEERKGNNDLVGAGFVQKEVDDGEEVQDLVMEADIQKEAEDDQEVDDLVEETDKGNDGQAIVHEFVGEKNVEVDVVRIVDSADVEKEVNKEKEVKEATDEKDSDRQQVQDSVMEVVEDKESDHSLRDINDEKEGDDLVMEVDDKLDAMKRRPLITHLLECIGFDSSAKELDDVKDSLAKEHLTALERLRRKYETKRDSQL
ncbi:hypothetical protein M9H77_35084 [Catharanthus roseus]|uniref:Uncharacterized protein n=1 Tax=Catharanthus roseus TaxID=4058 RepID=A0ACB9ZPQ7_CATRO|nr:hypothetical protein M9H77_35084 [Catharanthus roseus]